MRYRVESDNILFYNKIYIKKKQIGDTLKIRVVVAKPFVGSEKLTSSSILGWQGSYNPGEEL